MERQLVREITSNSSGRVYQLWLGKDENLYCSCPAWKFSKGPKEEKTCKHIKQAVREEWPTGLSDFLWE